MGLLLAIQGASSQGVLWGIMTLGLFITFKILDFADLTVDGSFALGGFFCTKTEAHKGYRSALAQLTAVRSTPYAGWEL